MMTSVHCNRKMDSSTVSAYINKMYKWLKEERKRKIELISLGQWIRETGKTSNINIENLNTMFKSINLIRSLEFLYPMTTNTSVCSSYHDMIKLERSADSCVIIIFLCYIK